MVRSIASAIRDYDKAVEAVAIADATGSRLLSDLAITHEAIVWERVIGLAGSEAMAFRLWRSYCGADSMSCDPTPATRELMS